MRLSAKVRRTICLVIFSISIFVWVLLLFKPVHIMTIEHCHVSTLGPSEASLQRLLHMNPISFQLIGWGLMVVAMMLPKLTMPILHIYSISLKRRRLPLSLLFVFGYLAVWMAVGIIMISVILSLHVLMPGSYLPAIELALIAIVWQFSPLKQRCLNMGHEHRTLAAFGWPANRDALLFGVEHGIWCVGAGWAIMLLPMLLPRGHNLGMIIVTFTMLSEHLEHPKIPGWRIDFRAKLLRIIIAQTQIKLNEARRMS